MIKRESNKWLAWLRDAVLACRHCEEREARRSNPATAALPWIASLRSQ
jgi:hypothetical protein